MHEKSLNGVRVECDWVPCDWLRQDFLLSPSLLRFSCKPLDSFWSPFAVTLVLNRCDVKTRLVFIVDRSQALLHLKDPLDQEESIALASVFLLNPPLQPHYPFWHWSAPTSIPFSENIGPSPCTKIADSGSCLLGLHTRIMLKSAFYGLTRTDR